MPIDVLVVGADGNAETFYIPLRMMRGEKENPYPNINRTVVKDWAWTSPTYEMLIDTPLENIAGVTIDPFQLMADIDKSNNSYQKE